MRSSYELIFLVLDFATLILVPSFRPLGGLAEQIGEDIGRQYMRIDLILHHPFSFFRQGKQQLPQG